MPTETSTELELEESPPGGQHRARTVLALALSLLTAVNLGVVVWRGLGPKQGGVEAPAEQSAPLARAPAPAVPVTAAAPTKTVPGSGLSLGADPANQVVSHRVVAGRLRGRETVAGALGRAGLSPEQTFTIVTALRGVFDFRYARPGDAWRVKLDPDGALLFFEYERSLLESYCVTRDSEQDGSEFVGYRKEIPVEREVVMVSGTVHSSLYQSMISAGERPGLALMLAEVLAWDIDFYRDPRPNDTFRIIVEKDRYKSQTLRYGKILAAEYRGGVGNYRVFRYASPTGGEAFYDEEGQSAQKALLKAPMKFVHITSTFGNRRHPILGYNRMHQGIDYGAPTGTPIWAVGDGRVIVAGRRGANGNLVGLRHTNGYTTWYAHLSKINVREGARVHQKDIVGLVGTTGRSTGPHLHYGVKKDGHFLNPLTLKLPPRRPLPDTMLPDYQKHIAPLLRWLETPGEVALLSARSEPLQ